LLGSQDPSLAAQSEEKYQQFVLAAESAFMEAIKRKADYAPAHFQLALTYQHLNRLDDAVGKMESVAAYNPLDVGVHFQLAMLYLNRAEEGDLDRAQNSLEYAIELAPSYSNAHWFLASIYEQQDNISAAVREIEAVLSLNPQNEMAKARLNNLVAGEANTEFLQTLQIP
jgi:Tfp pilus assembly protein PilF